MAFGLPIQWHRVTRRSAASPDVFLIPKISYIIRHCKFVSQDACIFLKKNSKRHVKLEQKADEEKIYRRTEFSTSWTITSEKCTRAQVQENKSIYLSIYLSVWKPFWKRVYIYIYTRLQKGWHFRNIYKYMYLCFFFCFAQRNKRHIYFWNVNLFENECIFHNYSTRARWIWDGK